MNNFTVTTPPYTQANNKMKSRTWILIGWLPVLVIACVEVYLWTKEGDNSFIKAIRFHVYAFADIILFFACRYIWKNLLPIISEITLIPLRRFLQFILLAVFSVVLITIPMGQNYVYTEPLTLALVGNFLTGVVVFLALILLAMNTSSRLLIKLIFGGHISKETYKACSKWSKSVSLLITLFLCIHGSLHAELLHTEFIKVPIKGLDPQYNGTTVIQLSDLHMGPFIGKSRMEHVVKKVNELQGDVVVVTGDLVDSAVNNLFNAVKPIENVKSKYGTYFCTGNHEYYTGDVDNWIAALPKLNVKPLINDRSCLLIQSDAINCALYIAGIEDYDTRRIRYGSHSMDIHRALSGRTKSVPTIVLAHQPLAALEAIYWDSVRLVLSGHTHAGQIFPMMLPVYLYNPFFAGLYQPLNDVYVYVSAGTNYYLVPFRQYRPEITHITLISS